MGSLHALQVSGLRFTYKDCPVPALDGVDLGVAPGEFVALLGASGAGKSTLCFALNGLIPHFLRGEMSGEVRIFGTPTAERSVSQIAEQVGLLFQEFESQLFCTSVELEVAFGPENLGVPPAEIRRRVASALSAVGLAGLERREPATLSGGQKQRLALAAVLALDPRALVMDEPTTDMDPAGRAEVFTLARRLRADRGAAVVVAEHNTEAALASDRVLLLDQGRIVDEGAPDALLTRIERLEAAGIAAPAVARLLVALGEPASLSAEAAAARLRKRGGIDPDWAPTLRARDAARVAAYGAPLFEVEDLVHCYPNGTAALAGVSLTVHEGEFVALVGANGSGKTTLARHLNGLLRPRAAGPRRGKGAAAGVVRLAGQDSAGLSVTALGRTAGYVFQNPDHQIFAESVAEEVAFGPRNYGAAPAEVRERVAEALAAVGLTGREGEDPFSLTKGERQRVAVASVLATRPRALILDEPTTGLDHRERRSLMEQVRRLNEAGHTILCITHDLELVAEYAHRVVVLCQGVVLRDGPARDVLTREEELAAAGLRPPELVRLGSRLGVPFLTVKEGVEALAGVREREAGGLT